MNRRGARPMKGHDPGRLSACVCNTLRMVSRAVTQLYDDVLRPSGLRITQFSILATIARMGASNLRQLEDTLAIDQTTLTRSLNLLERDRVIERVPHPDPRIKAKILTSKRSRALEVARPLWTQAKARVVREVGPKSWADADRRLAYLFHVSRGRCASAQLSVPTSRSTFACAWVQSGRATSRALLPLDVSLIALMRPSGCGTRSITRSRSRRLRLRVRVVWSMASVSSSCLRFEAPMRAIVARMLN